ncbi:MAG TPA: branched-chain amino acid ABC transporter permease [Deltaproteobacteria bacterium]|nr:branched-chain amino acid ABC transporter permease [Deltaproteobacteria bacterium]
MYLKLLISGLALGSFYAIIALGFSMIFGVTRVFNLAHGELLLAGGYVAYVACERFGLGFWPSVPISVLALILLGVILYRVFRAIKEPLELNTIVFTFGLVIALQNLFLIFFSADYRILTTPEWSTTIEIFNVSFTRGHLSMFLTAFISVSALYFVLRHTFWGKALRATIQDREAVGLLGIDVEKNSILAFLGGIALVGLAGPFFASFHYIHPTGGIEATLIAIIVTIVAGVGHVRAVIWAGWGMGLLENLVTTTLGAAFREGVTSLVLIAILLYKPCGLADNQ